MKELFEAITTDDIRVLNDTPILNEIPNINYRYEGMTALELACRLDRSKILQLLIGRSDVDINAKNQDKVTLLDICIQNDSFSCAQLLLSAGISKLTCRNVADYFDSCDPAHRLYTDRHTYHWIALLLAYDFYVDDLYIEPQANQAKLGLHKNKQHLFWAMKQLDEPARSLAMEKAIDESTLLGHVFYFKNGFFAPDCSRKDCTLYEIAMEKKKLNKLGP